MRHALRAALGAAALATSALLSVGAAGAADEQRDVELRLVDRDAVSLGGAVVDRLTDGDVLRVHVTGASEHGRGQVRQCLASVESYVRCRNSFPVQFREDGTATFQYQVSDPGGCDGSTPCVLVVEDLDDGRRAGAFTVFGGPAPPAPVATVDPAGPYEPGQRVRVDASGVVPGATVTAGFCATTCGPIRQARADSSGHAEIEVLIGDRCRRCVVVVVAGVSSTTLEAPFVAAPSARYDVPRLISGLVAAAALLLLAWWIVANVDWRPPSEAATPDLDAAPLE